MISHIKWVFEIDETVFPKETYINATLIVPQGMKYKYENTPAWNRFLTIDEKDIKPQSNLDLIIRLSNTGYATFYHPDYDFKLPSGLRAFIVTKVDEYKPSYRVIADGSSSNNIIPAGVPVILQSKDAEQAAILYWSDTKKANNFGTNLLRGTAQAMFISPNSGESAYKLTYDKSGNSFGWYWGANNGDGFQMEANKAWLAVKKKTKD